MAVFIVITRPDKPELKIEVELSRKLILGNSGYCDVVLEDKSIASMQCEIFRAKTGHVIGNNLDLKKEVHLNQLRLKKSPIKVDDVLKIGPFILRIDPTKLTQEELSVINSEYEEFV
jgi:Inner membrane component of T3SS, cytoplasmic domain